MHNQITIREAVTHGDIKHFWQQLNEYHATAMKLATYAQLRQSTNTRDTEAGSRFGQVMQLLSTTAGAEATWKQWAAEIPNLCQLAAGEEILKEYGEEAGLKIRLTPQVLRNSFAVHMLQNGADIKSIQELMGHEDIAATQAYLAVTKNRIKDVYDRAHPRA